MTTTAIGSKAFVEARETVRQLLARVVREEVLVRHQIGLVLRAMRHAVDTYGDHAVERIANDLNIGADTLYRCVLVADTWTPDEVRALTVRTNRRGEPLSWSHLVALTKVASASARRSLIDRCLAEDWSVRDLVQHIASASPRDAQNADLPEVDSVRVALKEGAHSASKAASEVTVFIEALESRLTAEPGDDLLLKRTISAYEALHEKVEKALACLRGAETASGYRIRAASPVNSRGPRSGSRNDD
jgi:hypothetical protein